MAVVFNFLIHCLWAAVACFLLTQCRAWFDSWVGKHVVSPIQAELKETKKTVEWLKSELEKLRAVPKMPPRF